jgi:hypothetical protein
MIHNHWLSISHHDSQPLILENTQWLWWAQLMGIMLWYARPVVVNQGFLCWAGGCESWFIRLRQWLWIIVYFLESVVVNHGVICWVNGCESLCVILSQWLWIIAWYAEPLVMNHGMLCWASGCESWWLMLSQWLWIMVCYAEPVVVHLLRIIHLESQHLAQNNTPWFTTSGSE